MKSIRNRRGLAGATAVLAVAGTVAAGLVAFASNASAAGAGATSSIDFTTTADGPTSGTLGNGVNWTVDTGEWSGTQGYIVYGGHSQHWTFDQPVTVEFSIAGLNCGGEAMQVPAGSTAVSIDPALTWDPSTDIVANGGSAAPDSTAEFAITTPTTTLDLTAVGVGSCGRGLTALSVTYDPPPTVSVNSPIDHATYFQGQQVPVDYSCTPTGAGDVSSCVGSVPDGANLDTSTTGEHTFVVTGTNSVGLQKSMTAVYTVVAVDGACRGRPGMLLNQSRGTANLATTPCATDAESVLNDAIIVTPGIPLLHIPAQGVSVGIGHGWTQSTPGGAAAQSEVAKVDINLLGISLQVDGVRAEASSQLSSCDAAATLGGSSYIAKLTLNGKSMTIGDKSLSIPLPLGLGGLYVNQTVTSGNTVTHRALFLDLPGTGLDIILAEAVAGATCACTARSHPFAQPDGEVYRCTQSTSRRL